MTVVLDVAGAAEILFQREKLSKFGKALKKMGYEQGTNGKFRFWKGLTLEQTQ